jgi:hypothetical protein
MKKNNILLVLHYYQAETSSYGPSGFVLFRVIMEHEDIFFCFWPFVNTQELLEVTIQLNYL